MPMPDDPVPESPGDLPKHFLVKIDSGSDIHFIVCEAVVSFDTRNLFDTGVKALQEAFGAFHQPGVVEVAALPPTDSPHWAQLTFGIQMATPRGGGGG